MYKKINPKDIVVSPKYQGLCRMPYKAHPKGCPCFGIKKTCPPKIPLMDEIFDFSKDIFIIYTKYPLGQFAERMRKEHPQWKDHPKQWYNPIRWQSQARKLHRKDISDFLKEHPEMEANASPEGHGVNVDDLMKKLGINLDWNCYQHHSPKNITYRISLAGYRK